MKKKILIAIDDGHGKETAGKRSPAFSDGKILKENDFNERTAEFLQEALQRNGFDTLMVAPEDTDTPLKTRVQRANDARADVYISIHANAHGTEWNGANGIETWVYKRSDAAKPWEETLFPPQETAKLTAWRNAYIMG